MAAVTMQQNQRKGFSTDRQIVCLFMVSFTKLLPQLFPRAKWFLLVRNPFFERNENIFIHFQPLKNLGVGWEHPQNREVQRR